MTIVEAEPRVRSAEDVCVTDEELRVKLTDGRTVAVPLDWYPRLLHSTHAQSRNVRLIGKGTGIHWPDIDEDISVLALLLGKRSKESKTSFGRWHRARGGGVVEAQLRLSDPMPQARQREDRKKEQRDNL